MILDRGEAVFYKPAPLSSSGNMPSGTAGEGLRCWYGELRVGITRFYAAKQVNDRVDMLIRIIRPDDSIKIGAEWTCDVGESTYRVLQVQPTRDEEAGEEVMDISLERIGDRYARN